MRCDAESPFPVNILLSTGHSIFVKGDQTNFEIGADGVEASQLYPEVKYTTVEEYLSQYVWSWSGEVLDRIIVEASVFIQFR